MNTVDELPAFLQAESNVILLDLDLLVPSTESLRSIGANDCIEELSASIAEHGVLQPLLVRPDASWDGGDRRYEIIAGHRRHKAAQIVGLSQVPCVIHAVNQSQGFLLSVIENLQRENLHPLDEAWAYDRMIEKGIVHNRAEIARRLGVSRARITQRMKLLELDEKTKMLLVQYVSTLSEYHARLLLRVDNLDARHHLAEKAGRDALSGRELREMIEDLEKQRALDAWRETAAVAGLRPSYRAYFSGLRLSIDFARVDKRQAADLFRRLAAELDEHLEVQRQSHP